MIHKFSIPKFQTYPDMTGILGILTALGIEKNWIYNNYLLLWSYNAFTAKICDNKISSVNNN